MKDAKESDAKESDVKDTEAKESDVKDNDAKYERRKKIVNSILKRIRNIGLPDNLSGFLFRSLHLHLPLYLLLMLLYLPFKMASIVLVISLMIPVGYIYYGGCILTSVEKVLCKNTDAVEDIGYITIVDPLILLNKDEITGESRKSYTIIVQTIWIIIMILIYVKRVRDSYAVV